MTTTLRALIAAGVVVASFSLAVAKLPPPPSDEASKAAAAAKKEKDAATAEKDKAELAAVQDRVVSKYIAEQKAKGKSVTPQMGATATPPPAKAASNGKKK
jgi:hypothetical protein